ncbi:apolipoprotein N-acyltransferase [Aliagarivorans taiwanensis]|uniref:apolipoprotein N-acyltransferase n=1 Tax=Aliagarivorans taiwanensis TaxID=561966 RepID=UPI0004036ACB|nr:apolipoprotein N-acyltransferase [Aliagarivorans taiwanensis]
MSASMFGRKPRKPMAPLFLALLLGLMAPFAFAPYGYWPLMLLSFAGLSALMLRSQRPFLLGFCYGLGWFGYGINWVHVSMAQFGGMPLIASLALMALLAAYLSLYPALACWLAARWRGPRKTLFLLLWLPGCWLFAEWLRSWVLTGFPWLQFGYSQIDSPLSGLAPIGGVFLVTWLVMLLANSLVLLAVGSNAKRLLAALVIAAALLGGHQLKGIDWTEDQETIEVALVQGNIDLNIKWLPEYRWPTLNLYQQASFAHPEADVIIWPESAIAALEYEVLDFLHPLNEELLANQQALITGVISHDLQSDEYYNALITLGRFNDDDPRGYVFESPNRYYKNHLLPIGEFVPFEDLLRPLAPFFNLPMSSFDRGSASQPNLQVNGHAWLAAICYEIAFGELLRGQFSEQTDAIITVSNDGWFGTSIGPWQHLEIAQMRAVEFGRPIARATNTGMSVIINKWGDIDLLLEPYTQVSGSASLTPATGSTPYQQLGRWPLWLLMALAASSLLLGGRKQTRLFR